MRHLTALWQRRWVRHLSWTGLILVGTVFINLLGIRWLGDIPRWQTWLQDHRLGFFLWRCVLYGATGYGWLWMRQRLYQREPSLIIRARLRRAEVAALLTVVLLESSVFLQG
jgi:hypothetical protein